jgi:hypothetical protein
MRPNECPLTTVLLNNYAIQIESEHTRKSLKELRKAKMPEDWSLESRGIAIEKAYLHGELKGRTDKDTAVELPEGYTKAAKVMAERQAALAGYRLADRGGFTRFWEGDCAAVVCG